MKYKSDDFEGLSRYSNKLPRIAFWNISHFTSSFHHQKHFIFIFSNNSQLFIFMRRWIVLCLNVSDTFGKMEKQIYHHGIHVFQLQKKILYKNEKPFICIWSFLSSNWWISLWINQNIRISIHTHHPNFDFLFLHIILSQVKMESWNLSWE
jgi:hypothetical protein